MKYGIKIPVLPDRVVFSAFPRHQDYCMPLHGCYLQLMQVSDIGMQDLGHQYPMKDASNRMLEYEF